MSELEIRLAAPEPRFRPGDLLAGTVRWSLQEDPHALELRLIWYTDGRGDRDAEVVDVVRFGAPGRDGEREFAIELPHAPYSFSGKLITLTWALEAVVLPGETSERVDLEFGPDGRAIDLHALGHVASGDSQDGVAED